MPFNDDIRQLADLKQQISQKMILHRSTITLWRCAVKWYHLLWYLLF